MKILPHCWLSLLLAVFAGEPVHAACAGAPSPHCGKAPSAFFSPGGELWVVFADAGHVYFTRSRDKGVSYEPALRVNAEPEDIYTDGENRPVLAATTDGAVLVAWTRNTGGAWNGDIRFARSTDGGNSFGAVRTVNDDGLLTSHRFVALQTTAAGSVYLAWLDKRDLVAAQVAGQDYAGAALYYTVSTDGGVTFSANRKVADHSCECCRIALADSGTDAVRALWRHLFEDGAVRDHASVLLGPQGTGAVTRATRDDWRIAGCPHHGPAMVAADGGHHLAWFSNGERQRGVLYGWRDAASGETVRVQVLEEKPAGGHPAILAQDEQVLLAWNQFDGEAMTLKLARSGDDGRHWSLPEAVLATSGAADHPQLLADGASVWLAWHTAAEGYRLLRIDPHSPVGALPLQGSTQEQGHGMPCPQGNRQDTGGSTTLSPESEASCI